MSATFEQWIKFVFDHPVREKEWYWDEDFASAWEALGITDALIVEWMTQLFLEPTVLRPYSLEQIDQGLWFLLGKSSPGCPSEALLRREATLCYRVACIHAMFVFFRDFILQAAPAEFDPHDPLVSVSSVAYMWWDIFPMHFYMCSHTSELNGNDAILATLEKLELSPDTHAAVLKQMAIKRIEIEPEIHDATLKVMSEVLDLPSETCQYSALHGLGHWHAQHSERVERIVDAFLARHNDLKPHLKEYSLKARRGDVL